MKKALSAVTGVTGGIAVVALMIVSVTDALSRAFGAPILGAKEISEALMVVCVGAALPMSVLRGRTISIDGLVQQFPPFWRKTITYLGLIMSVAAMGLLSWQLVAASGDARDFEETTALLQIPHHPLYLFLALGAGVTALGFILGILSFRAEADEESH